MKIVLIILGVLGVVVVGVFLFNTDGVRESTPDKLPQVSVQDMRGDDISLTEFVGKPLVVNSWAVWCPFCRRELPDFAALQVEFPNITVIAVDRAEPIEIVREYTDELGITHALTLLLDPNDDFYRAIGGFSMPETIFVDKSGSIVFHKRGIMTLDEMRVVVNQHLLPTP